MMNTQLEPVRFEANAIRRPSGDQTGSESVASWAVSRVAVPPSLLTVHRSPAQAKARVRPSG
jgi:hypothetical protein